MSLDEWDFYITVQDGYTQSTRLDLALQRHAPVEGRPVCVRVILRFRAPRADGLPGRDEREDLLALEDALVNRACHEDAAIYAACVSGRGERVFVFYASGDEAIRDAVSSLGAEFPLYPLDMKAMQDPAWAFYLDELFPGVVERQQMLNRGVYEELEKNGDTLEEPRDVSHWLYFPSQHSRDRFMARVGPLGFSLREAFACDAAEGRPGHLTCGVTIVRSDIPCPEAFDEVTVQLAQIATSVGGEYDGWETAVVAPEQPIH